MRNSDTKASRLEDEEVARRRYPTKAAVSRAVAAARAIGLNVAGIRLWPDGSIAVFDASLGGLADAAHDDDPIEFD